MRSRLYGAIEAGGTKFLCAIADDQGHILVTRRIPTTNPQATLAACADFFDEGHNGSNTYTAIGIAAFGPLDLHSSSPTYGHILATPKPLWSHTNLVAPFVRFDCPVAIDTDVNAAALAEAGHGAGRGCDVVVYVTVGTGIGGGVCIKGQTLHGALHPEMGHIRVQRHESDHDFPGLCPFHSDCLEGLASGAAIVVRYGKTLDELPEQHEAYDVIGHYLGQLAATVILVLSPQRLIFGGGVMHKARLLDCARQNTALILNGYAGLGGSTSAAMTELIRSPGLGDQAGLRGAIALAEAAGASQRKAGQ